MSKKGASTTDLSPTPGARPRSAGRIRALSLPALPMSLRSLALISCLASLLATAGPAAAVSVTAEVTAESALVGLKLAARQSAARGTLTAAQNDCFQALAPSEYFEAAEQIVNAALSPAELAAADTFFTSATGRKYALHGLLGLYVALNLKTPEPLPRFTAEDIQAIESFTATPVGEALVKRQVLESPAARAALDGRSQALVKRCKPAKPLATD